MKIITCEQGSSEWHEARRCKVTGTGLQDVMGTDLARNALIAELIAEEATEQSKIWRATGEAERGSLEEPFAIKAFEKKTNMTVVKVGFCVSDEFPWLGHSPDGLVEIEGLYKYGIEIKSPDSKTAIMYRMANEVPGLTLPKAKQSILGIPQEYWWQIINYFLVIDTCENVFFTVYDERFIDEDGKVYIVNVERKDPLVQKSLGDARSALESFRQEWIRCRDIVLPSKF